MRVRRVCVHGLVMAALGQSGWSDAGRVPKAAMPACRVEVVEGELNSGKGFEQPIGNALKLWFQPIASGWILRVVPVSGPLGDHDYAELATPPYRSVTPLSLSTDFAFRAQDAVGWNPRRFRLATSEPEMKRLTEVYQQYQDAGATPPATLEVELAEQVSKAAEGKLTIVDAKLVPGMADQWRMAAAVSSRFQSTAHTLLPPVDGLRSALGKLVWIRFRIEVALPAALKAVAGTRVLPHACGSL